MDQQQDNVMDTEETATGKVDASPDNKEQEVTPASPLKENEPKEVNDHPQNSSESVIDNEGGEESVNSVLPELPDVLPPSEDSSTTGVTVDNPPENMETDMMNLVNNDYIYCYLFQVSFFIKIHFLVSPN